MKEIVEDDRHRNAQPVMSLVVLVRAVRGMRVQYKRKLWRNGKEAVPVPTVHQPVWILWADPLLRKDTVSSMRPLSKEMNLVVRASEGNKGWPKAE